MSSTQSFIRQRSQPNTIFQAPTNECYYVFVASPGNYVGNYPPGYMLNEPRPEGKGSLLRDMGKTIKAPLGIQSTATYGFFRQVQFIDPQPAVFGTTFGVGIGSQGAQTLSLGSVSDTGYGTYYLPIIVDGTVATSNGITKAELPSPYLEFGGQM